ncbi:MAG: hypothetical protein OEV36_08845 [Myxococcales bacterium]|nr:hypothetical protein [Myxococcales bacterium]
MARFLFAIFAKRLKLAGEKRAHNHSLMDSAGITWRFSREISWSHDTYAGGAPQRGHNHWMKLSGRGHPSSRGWHHQTVAGPALPD